MNRKRVYQLTTLLLVVLMALLALTPSTVHDVRAAGSGAPVEHTLGYDLPIFKLPYRNGLNVAWTGGPHAFGNPHPETPGSTFQAGLGSGLDFSLGYNNSFDVLAMAPGNVIAVRDGDLGWEVAIQHDIGETVLIYGHLEQSSVQALKQQFEHDQALGVPTHVPQGAVLGRAGNSGGQPRVHLHIDLRDGKQDAAGNWLCAAACFSGNLGGSPLDWGEGLPFVDGYRIWSYVANLDDPITYYNYDGSAVRSESPKYFEPGIFYYNDSGLHSTALVRVHEDFECTPPGEANPNCELPANHNDPAGATKFAVEGRTYGFGSAYEDSNVLISSNEPIDLFDSPVLDLIFVIDTTGSMGDDIAVIKENATDIVNRVSERVPDYRIALVTYRDYPISPYGGSGDYPARTDLAFSQDPSAVISAINGINVGGGGDWRESVYTSLIHAILDPSVGGWRDGASKQIILLGDAPPHIPEVEKGYTLNDVYEAAISVDPAIVHTITVGGDPTTEAAFADITFATGGQAFTAATADDVVEVIMEALDKATEPPTDTTAPVIQIQPGIAAAYTQGTPIGFVVQDEGGSGLAETVVMFDNMPVENPFVLDQPGSHTYEVIATDGAGNTTTERVEFQVYTFNWRPPLKQTATNRIQNGATVPVKFSVLDDDQNLVVDESVTLTLYDNTGMQKLEPVIYNINNPNMYVDAQRKQYIHTLHTRSLELEPGLYELCVTFDSPDLIGRNTITLDVRGK